jgi:hypothetical protein
MNLQPSLSISFNDRRALFADELRFGGHGQRYLSGGGTYTPSTSEYVFYKIDFLTDSVVTSAVFRNVAPRGDVTYLVNNSEYVNVPFVKNSMWNAPLTSITLSSGTAIAYQYKKFIVEDLIFEPCPPLDGNYLLWYSDNQVIHWYSDNAPVGLN